MSLRFAPKALDVLDRIAYHYDEPFGDPSAIPTYYVAQIARSHVKVVLNGDGGDESFFGYTRYLNCNKLDRLYQLPRQFLSALDLATRLLPSRADRIKVVRNARLALEKRNEPVVRRYEHFVAHFSDHQKSLSYGPAICAHLQRSALDVVEPYLASATTMTMGAVWADLHTYLPDDLLVKVDIASMAHSLEARSPFLDHVLMSWAASLPEHQRFRPGKLKPLLKKAMEPHLPKEVLCRKKMGFDMPVARWLRNDLRQLTYDTLLGEKFRRRGILKASYMEQLLAAHMQGSDYAEKIWALLMLELWFQKWIDSPGAAHRPDLPYRAATFSGVLAA